MFKNTTVYLSGPIEFNRENWRPGIKVRLEEECGMTVLDPGSDPKQQWLPEIEKAKRERSFGTMKRVAHDFFRRDLDMVGKSDMLVGYLPYAVPTVGTHHEIIESWRTMKPTLLVCPEGVDKIPVWYFGFIPLDHMFGSWDDMFGYLAKVASGEEYDSTWHLIKSKQP